MTFKGPCQHKLLYSMILTFHKTAGHPFLLYSHEQTLSFSDSTLCCFMSHILLPVSVHLSSLSQLSHSSLSAGPGMAVVWRLVSKGVGLGAASVTALSSLVHASTKSWPLVLVTPSVQSASQ